jgi:hypothetical protein
LCFRHQQVDVAEVVLVEVDQDLAALGLDNVGDCRAKQFAAYEHTVFDAGGCGFGCLSWGYTRRVCNWTVSWVICATDKGAGKNRWATITSDVEGDS